MGKFACQGAATIVAETSAVALADLRMLLLICDECAVPAVTPPPLTTSGPCSGNIQATYDCGSTCSAGSGRCLGIAELQCTSGEC